MICFREIWSSGIGLTDRTVTFPVRLASVLGGFLMTLDRTGRIETEPDNRDAAVGHN
jgi:hypothetical protein